MFSKSSIPYLHFEFVNQHGEKQPLGFSAPIKVIIAQDIKEVSPALQEVENAINSGYYAAGYISYEAAPAFDSAFSVRKGAKMPLLWFGIFKEPNDDGIPEENNSSFKISGWHLDTKGTDYNSSISHIKDSIEKGDTYQVNYTMRLKANFEGDDFSFYRQLTKAQSSNYSAYLNTGRYSILSASPELFFKWDGKKITTRPMKGTVERGKWLEEDDKNASWLYRSEKNRSENLMIVDLLRNDLGCIAVPGSVEVPALFDIEKYPTVLQMTSTITAHTSTDVTIEDIFRALFPCGSITGAPKVSTMRLISELEKSPREVYCGSIGYITPQREAVFNVPIRTVIVDHEKGTAEYGVGGGITWDSTVEGEYNEALTKAKLLTTKLPQFELLETIKLEFGKYKLLDHHLERLEKSAIHFEFNVSIKDIKSKLNEYARIHSDSVQKVRLLVSCDGNISVEGTTFVEEHEVQDVVLAHQHVSKNNPFLYHKTTNRKVYEFHRKQHPEAFDVLLWNEQGELTEFTTGNIVVEMNGKMWTPSKESGLLAGTLREKLLKNGDIQEKKLTKADLNNASRIWFINSVRGWIPVNVISKASIVS